MQNQGKPINLSKQVIRVSEIAELHEDGGLQMSEDTLSDLQNTNSSIIKRSQNEYELYTENLISQVMDNNKIYSLAEEFFMGIYEIKSELDEGREENEEPNIKCRGLLSDVGGKLMGLKETMHLIMHLYSNTKHLLTTQINEVFHSLESQIIRSKENELNIRRRYEHKKIDFQIKELQLNSQMNQYKEHLDEGRRAWNAQMIIINKKIQQNKELKANLLSHHISRLTDIEKEVNLLILNNSPIVKRPSIDASKSDILEGLFSLKDNHTHHSFSLPPGNSLPLLKGLRDLAARIEEFKKRPTHCESHPSLSHIDSEYSLTLGGSKSVSNKTKSFFSGIGQDTLDLHISGMYSSQPASSQASVNKGFIHSGSEIGSLGGGVSGTSDISMNTRSIKVKRVDLCKSAIEELRVESFGDKRRSRGPLSDSSLIHPPKSKSVTPHKLSSINNYTMPRQIEENQLIKYFGTQHNVLSISQKEKIVFSIVNRSSSIDNACDVKLEDLLNVSKGGGGKGKGKGNVQEYNINNNNMDNNHNNHRNYSNSHSQPKPEAGSLEGELKEILLGESPKDFDISSKELSPILSPTPDNLHSIHFSTLESEKALLEISGNIGLVRESEKKEPTLSLDGSDQNIIGIIEGGRTQGGNYENFLSISHGMNVIGNESENISHENISHENENILCKRDSVFNALVFSSGINTHTNTNNNTNSKPITPDADSFRRLELSSIEGGGSRVSGDMDLGGLGVSIGNSIDPSCKPPFTLNISFQENTDIILENEILCDSIGKIEGGYSLDEDRDQLETPHIMGLGGRGEIFVLDKGDHTKSGGGSRGSHSESPPDYRVGGRGEVEVENDFEDILGKLDSDKEDFLMGNQNPTDFPFFLEEEDDIPHNISCDQNNPVDISLNSGNSSNSLEFDPEKEKIIIEKMSLSGIGVEEQIVKGEPIRIFDSIAELHGSEFSGVPPHTTDTPPIIRSNLNNLELSPIRLDESPIISDPLSESPPPKNQKVNKEENIMNIVNIMNIMNTSGERQRFRRYLGKRSPGNMQLTFNLGYSLDEGREIPKLNKTEGVLDLHKTEVDRELFKEEKCRVNNYVGTKDIFGVRESPTSPISPASLFNGAENENSPLSPNEDVAIEKEMLVNKEHEKHDPQHGGSFSFGSITAIQSNKQISISKFRNISREPQHEENPTVTNPKAYANFLFGGFTGESGGLESADSNREYVEYSRSNNNEKNNNVIISNKKRQGEYPRIKMRREYGQKPIIASHDVNKTYDNALEIGPKQSQLALCNLSVIHDHNSSMEGSQNPMVSLPMTTGGPPKKVRLLNINGGVKGIRIVTPGSSKLRAHNNKNNNNNNIGNINSDSLDSGKIVEDIRSRDEQLGKVNSLPNISEEENLRVNKSFTSVPSSRNNIKGGDEGSIVNSSFSDFSYLSSASASASGYTPGIPGEGKKGHRHYITPTFENHAIASHLSAISEGIEGLNDISMNHHSFINPPHINSPHIQPTKYYTATSLTKPFAPSPNNILPLNVNNSRRFKIRVSKSPAVKVRLKHDNQIVIRGGNAVIDTANMLDMRKMPLNLRSGTKSQTVSQCESASSNITIGSAQSVSAVDMSSPPLGGRQGGNLQNRGIIFRKNRFKNNKQFLHPGFKGNINHLNGD